MSNIATLDAPLRCALRTLEAQPREVPQVTQGWADRAQAALDENDELAMTACSFEIARAHSQYRAEFDIRGWLFDLRNVLQGTPNAAAIN